MKLINIEIQKYIFSYDIELRIYFLKWKVATFRIDPLTEKITREKNG